MSEMSTSVSKDHVVVLGGGVIGLSTALCLLDSPSAPTVTLVSSELPPDPFHPATYASSWAGAHHVSTPTNFREVKWDRETFRVIRALAESPGGWPWERPEEGLKSFGASIAPIPAQPLTWVRQHELSASPPKTELEELGLKVLRVYPYFQEGWASSSTNPFFQTSLSIPSTESSSFHTLDFNVPLYISLLHRRFVSLGGRVIKAKVRSLDEAINLASTDLAPGWTTPTGVFVAAGLGAKHLAEIQDQGVFPVRGQTVLVNAPWMIYPGSKGTPQDPHWPAFSHANDDGDRMTYIIPRGDGQFIIGGTRIAHDDDPNGRPETTKEILSRALEFAPCLLPPHKRPAPGIPVSADSVSDVEILGINVGLRPARRGGPIVEDASSRIHLASGKDVKVILGYGFGGYGYQTSWGAAMESREIVRKALGMPELPERYTLSSLEDAGLVASPMPLLADLESPGPGMFATSNL